MLVIARQAKGLAWQSKTLESFVDSAESFCDFTILKNIVSKWIASVASLPRKDGKEINYILINIRKDGKRVVCFDSAESCVGIVPFSSLRDKP